MSDEVGVDPERVAQAATALEQLRDVLAAKVPVIANTLNQYGSSLADLSSLRRAQARPEKPRPEKRS